VRLLRIHTHCILNLTPPPHAIAFPMPRPPYHPTWSATPRLRSRHNVLHLFQTNCPPLPFNNACRDQACNNTNWPDLPYCDTNKTPTTFNATICNAINGCTFQGKNGQANATYSDCWTCNDPAMQHKDKCDNADTDLQDNCVWRNGLCDSSQVGPVGFIFNYSFSITNDNYLAATLLKGHVAIAFTDITDSGEEQSISVFDGEFSGAEIPARSTRTVIVPINVTIDAVNFTKTLPHSGMDKVLVPIESLKRIILHDVCAKTAGKCGKDAGGGDLPERNQFFVTLRMNLTASTGPAKTPLNQNRVIALRRHCPIVPNSTTTPTTTPTSTAVTSVPLAIAEGGGADTSRWTRGAAAAPPLVLQVRPRSPS
jgi:hypothetical protein